MPALSYLTMRNRVALALGNMQSSDPHYAALGAYVNDALNKLILRVVGRNGVGEAFPELRKKWTNSLSVAGQAYVAIPADALAIQTVFSFDSASAPDISSSTRQPVSWVAPDTYELLPKTSSTAGYPRLWTQEGSQVILYPTPRAGYTTYLLLKGVQQETELSADGDLPVMDKRWHSAVVDLASSLLAADMGWADDAARFLASCDQKIANSASILGFRYRRLPLMVRTA